MSNFNQQPPTTTQVGSNIAAKTGAIMYEDEKPGASLSGGAAPSTFNQSQHDNSLPGASSHTQTAPGGTGIGATAPAVTDVGVNTGGQSLSNKVKDMNSGYAAGTGAGLGASNTSGATGTGLSAPNTTGFTTSTPQGTGTGFSAPSTTGSTLSAPQGTGAGLNAPTATGPTTSTPQGISGVTGQGTSQTATAPGTSTTATAPGTTSGGQTAPTGTLYEQAARTADVVATKAQELSQPIQPYIQKAQETIAPYVDSAVETTSPYVKQAQEIAQPYVEKASELANQGLQAAAAELDKRGVNAETTQQKLAEVSQNLKDYGAMGQARAGEYAQKAIEQVQTIGADRENKNIFATVFGTIALIWLAFGFSLTALLALGIAGSLAAVLSRYSRATVTQNRSHSHLGGTSNSGAGSRSTPGVETHYPNPSHPDNSLNN